MTKKLLRLTALILTVLFLCTGCLPIEELLDLIESVQDTPIYDTPEDRPWVEDYKNPLSPKDYIHYSDMEYARPELSAVQESYDALCRTAQGSDAAEIMDAVYAFYEAYDWYYTHYSMADIRYCGDMTDSYWEAEYNYCVDNAPAVDAMLEEMYYVLAKSPARNKLESVLYFGFGFFDDYDGENQWDDTFTALLEEESALVSEYYALFGQAQEAYEPGTQAFYDAYADDLAQILVELIALRQEIAGYVGYTTYDQFAWDFYYYRDYTPAQVEDYLDAIARELVPLYENMDGWVWNAAYGSCTEEEMIAYLREAAMRMGGVIEESFYLMEAAQLYDLEYSPNKFDSSFEVFLTGYGQPFIFLNAMENNYDCLTLAHEFGHFANDNASYGSYAGIDVMEIFSQGMEYLSLCYVEDDRGLTEVKMADSLCTYVEQAAYAHFEQEAYKLTGDELTAENLYRIYGETAEKFGFEDAVTDAREFVTVTHYYTNPMYIISYVVSNDAAMQFYQLELENPGDGVKHLQAQLDTEEAYFLAFLDSAELESPFAPGRLESVRDMFEEILE